MIGSKYPLYGRHWNVGTELRSEGEHRQSSFLMMYIPTGVLPTFYQPMYGTVHKVIESIGFSFQA